MIQQKYLSWYPALAIHYCRLSSHISVEEMQLQ